MKYELHLQPGARVQDIGLAYRGADRITVGASGDLNVETPLGVFIDTAPVSYQMVDGVRVPVESAYMLSGQDRYGFTLGSGFDPNLPLVIDPGLTYSTFLGGTGGELGWDIAVDRVGNAYIAGVTDSVDFPVTPGTFDRTFNGGSDVFVAKLNPSGSALVYSTYLGGTNSEEGTGVAVDRQGTVYLTGLTDSTDFPTSTRAFDQTFNGESDVFVAKLNRSGSTLLYSTYLGGAGFDFSPGIAVDAVGNAYVAGATTSTDFPITPDAFDTTLNVPDDLFVTKLESRRLDPRLFHLHRRHRRGSSTLHRCRR